MKHPSESAPTKARKRSLPPAVQFLAGFVLPTVVLLTLSDESKLGPFWGMILALIPPVALELFSVVTGRKASWLSLFAIIGILLIGVISLFGLSEEWLGLRRGAIYAVIAAGLLVLARFRRPLIDRGLDQLIDMPMLQAAAGRRRVEDRLRRTITNTAYMLAFTLLVTAVWSYVLTIIVMTAPTGSSEFNAEYARLRLLSLPFVTLPLLVAVTGLLMYLLSRIERLTGMDGDELLRRKR